MHRLTGLTWLFLFMVLFLSAATCAAVRNFSSIGVDFSGVSRIAKGLGPVQATACGSSTPTDWV